MAAEESRVLVIGGGNCGLAIATGLQKAGIPYTILERTSEHDFTHNNKDWGMLLHWGYEYFEKLLPDHLLKRSREARVDPTCENIPSTPYLNASTGEVLKYIELPVNHRVSRRKLRKLLTEGQNLIIKFDKRLTSITTEGERVTAHFEDGTKEVGSMIVGCDGSHSRVREFLVGEEAAQVQDTGHNMINSTASGYTPEQARVLRSRHPIAQLGFNHSTLPGAALLAVLDLPDPNDASTWVFQIYTSWSGPPYARDLQDDNVRMKFVRERMAQFCEPFRTGFLGVDDNEVMPIYSAGQWAPRMTWDNHRGRVTIAGDAAHPVLPHRGQGLNNAIKDASDIVDAIKAAVEGTQTLDEGISAYEDEMRVRGTKEVELSYQQMLASDAKELDDSPAFKMGYNRNDTAATATINGV